MQLSDDDRVKVRALIDYISSRPAMSEADRKSKSRKHTQQVFQGIAPGKSYGEAIGFRGVGFNTNNQDEARQQLREIDNNLPRQIEVVRDGIEYYYESGSYPAPGYPWRIAVMLRKAQEYRLEAEFLDAFNARFSDGLGKRYQDLVERATKAHALANKYN